MGLRETARRIGVSPTAAYRHFSSKEDLLASVAAEGFRELSAALDRAMKALTTCLDWVWPMSNSPCRSEACSA